MKLAKPSAIVGAVMSMTLLTGCHTSGEPDELNNVPETPKTTASTISSQMAAELTKSCTLYTKVLKRADDDHFLGTATTDQKVMAQKAYQNMLQNVFSRTNKETSELLYADPKTKKDITGIRLGDITLTVPEASNGMQSYTDHCDYLKNGAIQLSKATGTSVFRLHEYAVDGAIKSSRDPHSTYEWSERAENTRTSTRGEFGGLGIEVRMTNGLVEVVSPINDTPAEKAGVLAGDLITHLNGKPVLGTTLDHAVNVMRGKPGEDITLTIKRGNDTPFNIDITRDIIKIQVVKAQIVGEEKNTGHIEIKTFNKKTTTAVINAITEFRRQQSIGDIPSLDHLVLDFRNNPGGLLNQAKFLADLFLQAKEGEKNVIVAVGQTADDNIVLMDDYTERQHTGTNIKVLINGGSASASEIVAGAMKDAGIKVIGTKSYGKGSVQTLFPIYESDGYLRLTTQLFFPGNSGLSNYKSGIIPNMTVRFNDARDEAAQNRRGEKSLDQNTLVPENLTRASNKPEQICSLKAKYAGGLSSETLATIPAYLVTSFRIKDAGTDEWKSVKGVDAPLACALKTQHVDIRPYTP